MLFNSFSFLPFLAFVLVLFYFSPNKFRRYILLATSYVFYGLWDWRFCFLLLLSTVIDFFCGRKLVETKSSRSKKWLLALSLSGNLGVLILFKYYGFFVENFALLLTQLGMKPQLLTLNIILPVGISFYTLQTLAYTIDVWRGKMKPTENFVDFANYVAFFPQLVAGPIERAQKLLPQLVELKKPNRQMIEEGAILLLFGYVKKVIISDNIASVADRIFANYESVGAFELWQGVLVFAVQIYCDFSGYSNIARGIAKWFGVELMVNFNCPYFKTNISDFWRNWHISLSSWIRDYVYIPMGGSHVGAFRSYFNVFFSMVLVGVWHGANWTFIALGASHGIFLCIHKKFGRREVEQKKNWNWWDRIWRVLLTQFCVLMTYVFFRSPDISSAMGFFYEMFTGPLVLDMDGFLLVLLLLFILIAVDGPILYFKDFYYLKKISWNWKAPIFGTVFVVVLFLLLNQDDGSRPFIYFQF